MAPGEQSAGFRKRLLARQIDESLQRYIDFGSSLCSRRACASSARAASASGPAAGACVSEPVDRAPGAPRRPPARCRA